jgi:Electron transfer DM13
VRALAAALAALAVLPGCGGGEQRASRPDPFKAIEEEFARGEADRPERTAPRWERLAVLRGEGAGAPTVAVAEGSIQWRVRWTCETGDFEVAVQPPPPGPSSSAGSCPGGRTQTFIGEGRHTLAVESGGRWRMIVEQQVETPLHEPPLEGMTDAALVRRGDFVEVERPSEGRARLYRLASGRLALRFEGFRTSSNTDLFVWLSTAASPRTTKQARRAPHRVLASLKSTIGDQNYLLPRSVRARDVRSIVIWCEPIQIAYTTAALRS